MRKEPLYDIVRKPLDSIEKIFTALAMASVFTMSCLTAADALGRYFLNQPISGTLEVIENYLMIFAIYFAFACAYKNGANVRLTFVVSRLPARPKRIINYFVQIFSILYIVFLFISASRVNLGRMNNFIELTQKISIPLWPVYLVISVGLGFVSLFAILDLWRVKSGRSGLFIESSEEVSSM